MVALEANVPLHLLIPLYDVFYTRGKGELWLYDEMGNFILGSSLPKRGSPGLCARHNPPVHNSHASI
jgi:hypothetical protein